eukprot:2736409-Ditylum_brightwellii.AAC.1
MEPQKMCWSGNKDEEGGEVHGDTLTHWMDFKHVDAMRISKRLDRMDKPAKGICKGIYKVNGMLTHFPVPGNIPMAEDELCNIICQMKLLDGIKQKSETIVVDHNANNKKKPSNNCKKNANSDKKAKGNLPKGSHNSKRT